MSPSATAKSPLEPFSEPVRKWFEDSFEAPTPAQARGWPAIASGAHTLICAPTGSGKTLAAFLWGIDKLNVVRSDIPAVTHIDYSARIQTVSRETNPDYYDLIREFESLTGCAVVVNTSFNVRGEPIVCSPADAFRCFMRTHLDYLVLGPYLLEKAGQPEWKESGNWQQEFQLD